MLASNSPRRKQLFALGDWRFRVSAAEIDESILEGEPPTAYVQRLAEAKALAVVDRAQEDELIVAADTTVVDGSQILGKPADAQQAVSMLRQLRGRVHQVFTSLVVIRMADRSTYRDFCSTDVSMRDYSDGELAALCAPAATRWIRRAPTPSSTAVSTQPARCKGATLMWLGFRCATCCAP